MALSANKKEIAICEKSDHAICVIYELSSLKRRKVLCSNDCASKSFTAVAFAKSQEKLNQYLVTLSGEPDYRAIVWLWEKSRFIAQFKFEEDEIPLSCSFQPDDATSLLVTGTNVYKFFKINEQSMAPKAVFQHKSKVRCSTHYTCHLWLDKRIIVCTTDGEVLLMESGGEFKMTLSSAPGANFSIKSICPRREGQGFIISSSWGKVMIYETCPSMRCPFDKIASLPNGIDENGPFHEYMRSLPSAPTFRLSSMVVMPGDLLIYSTYEGQLLKFLLHDKPETTGMVSYLYEPFHNQAITGLATCLKKPCIVTTSLDRTLRLYNYDFAGGMLKLQLCEMVDAPIISLDLHPSGMYCVAATQNALRYYTVCQRRFVMYNSTPIKDCNLIRFSRGGHMFACQEQNDICVFRFFTGERPPDYRFSCHKGQLLDIQWKADDTGFVSTSEDKTI